MNKRNKTSYALLVRSEEKGRGLAETMVYALMALSVVVSIWQFARQETALATQRVQVREISHVSEQASATVAKRES